METPEKKEGCPSLPDLHSMFRKTGNNPYYCNIKKPNYYYMRLFLFSIFINILILLALEKPTFAQSYVADTLTINFSSGILKKFPSVLKTLDFRDENPRFVSMFEKKKFLFFPVDQIVLTPKPLTCYFENNLQLNAYPAYQLDIHDFYLHYNESWFNRSVKLNAYMGLSKIDARNDTTYLGIFYYEESKKFKKKDSIAYCYNNLWNRFASGFYSDLSVIVSDSVPNHQTTRYHFRKGQKAAKKNLYISTDVYYGYTFGGIDADIWFSEPEMAQKFKRNPRMFRYLNYGNRQSVGFSAKVSLLNYRINDSWLFQNKHGFIFGFNKWNDVDEAKRTFEELFLFQYALSQRIVYNPLNKSGFIFGVGLMEEASYIIYNDPIFSVGVLFNCAYKF